MATVTFDTVDEALRRRRRPSARRSRSRSPTASSWCSSARPAPARRPRCGCSPGSRRSPPGAIRIGDRVVDRRRAARPRHRDGLPGLRALPADDASARTSPSACGCARSPGTEIDAPRDRARPRCSRSRTLLDAQAAASSRAVSGSASRSGRALVREPQVFLMDEPLSNLDAKLRAQTRGEIKRAAAGGRHDDRLRHPRPGRGDDDGRPDRGHERRRARAGRRRPDEVYERPANTFVAGFIGSPAMSFATVHAEQTASALVLSRGELSLTVDGGRLPRGSPPR